MMKEWLYTALSRDLLGCTSSPNSMFWKWYPEVVFQQGPKLCPSASILLCPNINRDGFKLLLEKIPDLGMWNDKSQTFSQLFTQLLNRSSFSNRLFIQRDILVCVCVTSPALHSFAQLVNLQEEGGGRGEGSLCLACGGLSRSPASTATMLRAIKAYTRQLLVGATEHTSAKNCSVQSTNTTEVSTCRLLLT